QVRHDEFGIFAKPTKSSNEVSYEERRILPVLNPSETAPKWHSLMMIRLPVSIARIKQRISKD
ncbi:MAG: hypothetical protein PVI42_19220, partial [Desulfobacterales bacterium]